MERVLREGKTDFVGLAHQMLAEPHWANKVKEGRIYDIRPCIGCNECLYAGFAGKHIRCAVNPQCFHEDDYPVLPAGEKKSVLVIGGGPGGMQAAITAAERGFYVELWEKESKLGGTLLAAGAPSFKSDVLKYVEYLKNKLFSSNVTVRLLKEATVEEIVQANFDKVIVATGSKPLLPPIKGIDGKNVKSAEEVLLGTAKTCKKVVVIGGGLVGCETALHVKETAEKVAIIEMLDDILLTADHCLNNDQKLRAMIAESGIEIYAKAKVKAIGNDYVEYEKDGRTERIECDTVVVAAGYKPNNELAAALEGKIRDLSVIGDAASPRKIITAVHEGFHAVRLM